MPTLVITQQLGDAIRRLQTGWWLAKSKRGRYSPPTSWWMTQQSADATGSEELIKKLEKLKLIEGRAFSPYGDRHRYAVRRTRRIYEPTQYCLEFHLPSETLWIPDEQHLQPS